MRALAAILAIALTGCVTRSVIHARTVSVTVSPTVTMRAQGLPLSLP